MLRRLLFSLFVLQTLFVCQLMAQEEEWGQDLDSLRMLQDAEDDSVIYNASYIRYTTLNLLKHSTQTVGIDTTLKNFQYYNPQVQPRDPTMHIGNYGLATREMLFNPSKEIGFRTGFEALEKYILQPDSIQYYRARSPFSSLYFVSGDQVFSAKVGQNIKPNWSVGANFDVSLSRGIYINQRYNDVKPALYTWYESPNNRYNLISSLVFNTLVATENGSVLNNDLFNTNESIDPQTLAVRLSQTREQRPRNTWNDHTFFLRQSMYIGRIDTLDRGTPSQQILPTQTVFHSLRLNQKQYKFYKAESDANGAFPAIQTPSTLTNDSTRLTTITNDFGYNFSLRGRSVSFLKNEVNLRLGMQHDLSFFHQGRDSLFTEDNEANFSFQNITLKGALGYRFSDRVNIEANLRQIALGRNFGDFYYGGTANFFYSNTVGRLVLGAYLQNQSPAHIFESVKYTYHEWSDVDLSKTRTLNFSASYENPRFQFLAKAEYYLLNNFTYFREVNNPRFSPQLLRQIEPTQSGSPINVLKFTVGKDFTFGKWHFDNYMVYQQSDFLNILQTPELYTWHSFYYNNTIVKVINLNIGFDTRFNTPYVAPSYAINVGQFYLPYYAPGVEPLQFSTYPIVDVWLTATLKRTNFFLRYDYANQGLFSQGYYTVRRYPMPGALLRFGLVWNFYD